MKKIFSLFILFVFATSSLRAEEASSVQKQPRQVKKPSQELYNAGRAKQWQNIFLALAVVTVTVVTALLVANHHDNN